MLNWFLILCRWRNQSPDGKIAEFRFDPLWKTYLWEHGYVGEMRQGGWRFVRFCDDRILADNEHELNASWISIKDSVTLQMVCLIFNDEK